jgi:hypothetical protein
MDKYNVSIEPFKIWFARWYHHQGDAIQRIDVKEMLFPCWKFDHAEGFKSATHDTVYNLERRVFDKNPTNYFHIHLPARIVQQLNAARGRLRTILHRQLFRTAVRDTYEGFTNKCKKNCEFSFNRALYKTGAWPLEDTWLRESPVVVLRELDRFEYINNEKCNTDHCTWCTRDFSKIVLVAKTEVLRHFDGLCIDCLESPTPTRSLERENCKMRDDDDDDDDEGGGGEMLRSGIHGKRDTV